MTTRGMKILALLKPGTNEITNTTCNNNDINETQGCQYELQSDDYVLATLEAPSNAENNFMGDTLETTTTSNNDINETQGCQYALQSDDYVLETLETPSNAENDFMGDIYFNNEGESDMEDVDDSDRDKDYIPVSEEELSNDNDVPMKDDSIRLNENVELKKSGKKSGNIRKEIQIKRNLGKKYTKKSGKVVEERKLLPLLGNCRMKCSSRFNDVDRHKIFQEYWNLGCFNKRVLYLAGLIKIEPKKTCRIRNIAREQRTRNFTYSYVLDVNGMRLDICKECFKRTFNETNKFIETVIKKKKHTVSGTTSPDRRGKCSPANKISTNINDEVRAHINLYPAYESHYGRRDTTKKYLPVGLSMAIMYDMYKEKVQVPVSRTHFSKIFHTMNLSFKKPAVDTCNKCDAYVQKLKFTKEPELSALKSEYKNHKLEAEIAYECKKSDKETSNIEKRTYCFDLQQCLPTPLLSSNTVFYKRQLWTFNLTIYDCYNRKAVCYMWHEAEGGRGANQIASCLYNFIISLPEEIKDITFYSDTCGGQNKNSHVAVMFMCAMQQKSHIFKINHKFLVPGHTHMECDSVHAIIEKKKKATDMSIHHPRDWYNLVRSAGKKNQIEVRIMKNDMFLDFAHLLKTSLQLRKNSEEGGKVNWHDIKWFMYTKNCGEIYFKNSLNSGDDFRILNMKRRGHSKPILLPNKCYSGMLQISKEKKKDLLSILHLMDQDVHDFYIKLSDGNVPDTIPNSSSDDDEYN